MARKTILFGNGLGMSLDPPAYSLDNVLAKVWKSGELLTEEQKSLIRQCLPKGTQYERPSSEDDLDRLQQVLAACEVLKSMSLTGGVHWLSDQGLSFPDAIHRFIHSVSVALFMANRDGKPHSLPDEFINALCDFVSENKSHVATLNYDGLLDIPFEKRKLVHGNKGILIDGVFGRGFQRSNLFRDASKEQAWFLHLHGSPLYYDATNTNIKKLAPSKLNEKTPIDSTHLVLTHVRHKPTVIAASRLLEAYWEFFQRALDESDEVVLFGYSGADSHLNEIIAARRGTLAVRIIEWLGAGTSVDREKFWNNIIHADIELVQLESVFEFTEW